MGTAVRSRGLAQSEALGGDPAWSSQSFALRQPLDKSGHCKREEKPQTQRRGLRYALGSFKLPVTSERCMR